MQHKTRSNKIIPFIWSYAKNYKLWLLSYLVLWIFFSIICDSGMNYALKVLVDKITEAFATKESILSVLEMPLILYFGLFSITSICMVLYQYIRFKSLRKIENDIRSDVFNYLEYHSRSYFIDNEIGDLGNKLNNIPQAVSYILDTVLQYCFSNSLSICFTTYLLYKINHLFAIVFICWFMIFLVVTIAFGKKQITNADNLTESITLYNGNFLDIIYNIVSVKSFAMENFEKRNTERSKNDIYKEQKIDDFFNMLAEFVKQSLMCILMFCVVCIIISLKRTSSITNGDIVFILTSICGMSWTCNWISGTFMEMYTKIGVLKNSLQKLIKPYEIFDKDDAKELEVNKADIEFKNVVFNYTDDNKKTFGFNNLNLSIKAGERIGVVGYTGAGKSTLVSLLMRFHDVDSGEVLIDGQNVKDVTQKSLRQNISYIPQNNYLFHRTIRDNIRYGKLNATDEEILDVVKKARCDFVNDLQDGIEFDVGDKGEKLSNGQRQRIAIARAMLKDSKILVLDEVTSALDNITEKEINGALQELMKGKTVIAVTHRLITLTNMDKIIVMEHGKIVEAGTREELLQNENGLFYKMWETQKQGFIVDK